MHLWQIVHLQQLLISIIQEIAEKSIPNAKKLVDIFKKAQNRAGRKKANGHFRKGRKKRLLFSAIYCKIVG